MKKLFVTFLLSCLALLGMAQSEEDARVPLAYAYNYSLEVFAGATFNAKEYGQLIDGGHACFGKKDDPGFNLNVRYTYFLRRNWGAFAQLQFARISDGDGPVSRRVDDYMKYDRGTFDGDMLSEWGRPVDAQYAMALVGVTYRYDFATRWSLRPRIGLGYRTLQGGNYITVSSYKDAFGDLIHSYESFTFELTDKENRNLRNLRGFAYNGSLQLTFTPHRHFFFSAEASWTGTIRHLHQRTIHDVGSWEDVTETIHYDDGSYFVHTVRQETILHRNESVRRAGMGNFLDICLGVGWNIGWNRNARR